MPYLLARLREVFQAFAGPLHREGRNYLLAIMYGVLATMYGRDGGSWDGHVPASAREKAEYLEDKPGAALVSTQAAFHQLLHLAINHLLLSKRIQRNE
jgi:hypothetical protein